MSIRTFLVCVWIAVSLIITPIGTAGAATLRTNTVINSDTVRLSDLFSGLDPGQDQVLGPAPPPGESLRIEGRQLIAIADQYNVDWIDQSADAVVTIKRAGRVLTADFFANLVRKRLPDAGNRSSIEITNFPPITVALNDPAPVILSDLSWNRQSGYFTATIYRAVPTGDITRDSFLLKGFIRLTHNVLVYTHTIPMGSILQANDIRIDNTHVGQVTPDENIADPSTIVGMTLLRSVLSGEIVSTHDLHRTIIVHRGAPVLIVYNVPGIHMTLTGRALDNGGMDQYVRAINTTSGRITTGRVIGSSEISLAPGTQTVPANQTTAQQFGAPTFGNNAMTAGMGVGGAGVRTSMLNE